MTIRVKVTQQVQIYDDVTEDNCLYGPAVVPRNHDNFEKQSSGKFDIPAATSLSLSFGDVAKVYGYCIELQPASASTPVPTATLDVNGAGARALEPGTNPGIAGALYDGASDADPITSLVIANTGSTVLWGRYVVWGDPAS